MNCYDCARESVDNSAVAVCSVCSAGICRKHLVETDRAVAHRDTAFEPGGRAAPKEPGSSFVTKNVVRRYSSLREHWISDSRFSMS